MLPQEVDQSQVYEDVLFIGQVCSFVCDLVIPCAWRHVLTLYIYSDFQERCVEDWPEDSPEINPDWKPVCN